MWDLPEEVFLYLDATLGHFVAQQGLCARDAACSDD